jgi:hypothetical protein
MGGYSADPGMSPSSRRRRKRELGFLIAIVGMCIATFAAWNVIRVVLFIGDGDRAKAIAVGSEFRFNDSEGRFHYAAPSWLESLIRPDVASGEGFSVMYDDSGEVLFGRPAHLVVLYGVIGVIGAAIAMAGHELIMRNQDPHWPPPDRSHF